MAMKRGVQSKTIKYLIMLKAQLAIILCSFLFFSSACSQSTTRSEAVPVFDSTKTDIQTFRETFLKNLPAPAGYVNDFENLFSDQEEYYLDSLIAAFEVATTIEVALITLDSTATAKNQFDDLTLQIARKWGVGKKESNNGILIGISGGHRIIRIQNGYGIEKIFSDEETKKIIDDYILPSYRLNKLYEGTRAGLLEIIRILSARVPPKTK
jgi:uncharacterized protein